MAASTNYTPAPKARRMAFISIFVTGVLCILSLMSVNGRPLIYPFILVPTFAIYLWPQGANPIVSLIGVVLVGFWLDHISFGPMGLWALTWLLLFLIYRPDTRAKPKGFMGQFAGAITALLAVTVFQIFIGKLILSRPFDLSAAIVSVSTACLIFPLFYFVREYFARSYGNREDFFYEGPTK